MLSLVYRLAGCSFGLLAVLVRADLPRGPSCWCFVMRTRRSTAGSVAGRGGVTPADSGLPTDRVNDTDDLGTSWSVWTCPTC